MIHCNGGGKEASVQSRSCIARRTVCLVLVQDSVLSLLEHRQLYVIGFLSS